MTIALGILAKNGFLVAADRQETVPGIWKNEVSKVGVRVGPFKGKAYGAIECLSGAGNGHYVDAFRDSLPDSIGDLSPREYRERFGLVLRDFYHAHVLPFAVYPSHERPEFQVLAAYRASKKGRNRERDRLLLTSELSAVREHHRYAAIGSGAMLASSLLNRLFRYSADGPTTQSLDGPTIQHAVVLAAYVMAHVKDSIDGCGHATDIVIWNDEREAMTMVDSGRLEAAVRDYMDIQEGLALAKIGGDEGQRPKFDAGMIDTLLGITNEVLRDADL